MAAIWGAIISGAAGLGAAGVGYAGSANAANQAANMSDAQTGLARQLLLEGYPLRAGLTTGTLRPGDYDFVGFAEGGHVQKRKEALAALGVAGVDPGLLSSINSAIEHGQLSKLKGLQAQLQALPGPEAKPGIFPEFFATQEIPELLQPRPLPPLEKNYAPARETLEDQFDLAREQLIAKSGGRGGALLKALRLMETDRAKNIGALSADLARQQQLRDDQQVLQENALRQTLFGQGIQLAYGSVPTAMNAFGNAASMYAGLAQSGQASAAANLRAAGSSTALALALMQNSGTQTNVNDLGMTGLYNPPPNTGGGMSQGGFGLNGL
jgi:hypothetical protein